MDLEERKQAFLIALTTLSKEHGLTINGCGCCDSPYISEIGDGKYDDHPDGAYRLGGYPDVRWVNPAKPTKGD